MSDTHQAVRRDEYGTRGEAYRLCRQDPEAFAAGEQYALDKLDADSGPMSFDPDVPGG